MQTAHALASLALAPLLAQAHQAHHEIDDAEVAAQNGNDELKRAEVHGRLSDVGVVEGISAASEDVAGHDADDEQDDQSKDELHVEREGVPEGGHGSCSGGELEAELDQREAEEKEKPGLARSALVAGNRAGAQSKEAEVLHDSGLLLLPEAQPLQFAIACLRQQDQLLTKRVLWLSGRPIQEVADSCLTTVADRSDILLTKVALLDARDEL